MPDLGECLAPECHEDARIPVNGVRPQGYCLDHGHFAHSYNQCTR